jgi:hypothetical protein
MQGKGKGCNKSTQHGKSSDGASPSPCCLTCLFQGNVAALRVRADTCRPELHACCGSDDAAALALVSATAAASGGGVGFGACADGAISHQTPQIRRVGVSRRSQQALTLRFERVESAR